MPASTTNHSIKLIADELGIDAQVVEAVIDAYHNRILEANKLEMPFSMRGIGTFFMRYMRNRSNVGLTDPFYQKKVHKEVAWRASTEFKARVNGWVTDIGLKDNRRKELLRMRLRPDEIVKHRRRMVLEEQRKVGFKPSLLFDEDKLPHHDRQTMRELENSPSVDEISDIMNMNLLSD